MVLYLHCDGARVVVIQVYDCALTRFGRFHAVTHLYTIKSELSGFNLKKPVEEQEALVV